MPINAEPAAQQPGAEDLRFVLGLKLKSLRLEMGATLKEIASRAGLSISYLSELEKGKKYPKPEKLLRLSRALQIPFDELVSLKVKDELGPLKEVFSSGFLKEFPFEFFGLHREDLLGVIRDAPGQAGALIRTLVEVGKSYDVQVEHFLFSALRSYQQMHANYFEELELAAEGFRRTEGWRAEQPVSLEALRALLVRRWNYSIDDQILSDHPALGGFRSIFVDGDRPRLHVNGRLLRVQKAFILAREIGFRQLGLQERAMTSSWLKVESFAQVLNNFKASYFAGALLIDRRSLEKQIGSLLKRRQWQPETLLASMSSYQATPEMFLYRLTELMPKRFGLEEVFFLRFHHRLGSDRFALTKVFNLSHVAVPYGLGLKEHYCRRWPGIGVLRLLEPVGAEERSPPLITAQRSYYLDQDAEFFVISLARPLILDTATGSSVSIGLRINEVFKRRARFWDDPAIPRVEVNLTCERCPLAVEDCADRAAPPDIFLRHQQQARQESALAELVQGES